MRFLLQSCGFLLLTVMVASCERHRSGGCPHDATMRTYEQWRESASFPYTAPQIRKERIVKNIEKIRVGSTKEEVVAALGEPDYELEMYPKEPGRPCLGYEFMYYLTKPEDLANDIRDRRVEAFFSPAGKATNIFSNISEKDAPTTKQNQ